MIQRAWHDTWRWMIGTAIGLAMALEPGIDPIGLLALWFFLNALVFAGSLICAVADHRRGHEQARFTTPRARTESRNTNDR